MTGKARATKASAKRRPHAQALSLRSFAKDEKKPPSWVRCATCCNPTLKKDVADYVAMRDAGELQTWQSLSWLARWLLENRKIDIRPGTISNHIRNCLDRP